MTGTPGRSFILYQGADKVTYQDYAAQDGNTIVTTLDYNIQQYAEQAVKETMEAFTFGERGGNRDEPEYGGNLRDGFCGHL